VRRGMAEVVRMDPIRIVGEAESGVVISQAANGGVHTPFPSLELAYLEDKGHADMVHDPSGLF